MIKTIEYKSKFYPAFQAEGNAMQFCLPFAKKVLADCRTIYDVGCGKEEWKYPGAIEIDPRISRWDALNFPSSKTAQPDAIISSHCLEHIPDWVEALNYWHSQLQPGGIIFLYLPDHSQVYWRPYHNRKHIHAFTPEIIKAYFQDQPDKWKNVFCSGVDLNNSFICIAEKIYATIPNYAPVDIKMALTQTDGSPLS